MKKHISSYIFGILSLLLTFVVMHSSVAQVSTEGMIRYNSGRIEYCNGTEWISTDSGFTNGSCTTPGEIRNNSGQLEFCNGANWVIMN